MAETFAARFRHAWNVFTNRENLAPYQSYGYSYRPDRQRMSIGNERSIINAAYNRMAIDVSAIDIRQVTLDENDRYVDTTDSYLNECLSVEANLDQSNRSLMIDAVMSMFDEGVVALVPVDYNYDRYTGEIDIGSIRTGKITEWYPQKVKVRLYDERNGQHEEVIVDKRKVAIVENPFYSIMNEPNSTLKRLIRKLNLLDAIDEQSGSGKLDLIIQLPYVIKSDARRQQAENRRKSIEEQLSGSKYGIAYTDGTERITQLNRPVENNLMKQIEFLTSMLFSQLGMSMEILNGTADDKTMTNYNNRIIEPILSAFVGEFKRKWLTASQRKDDRQSIIFIRDPLRLVPISAIAEIADKFTRNEITTSNEIRQAIGMRPSKDPRADELRNKNISEPKTRSEMRPNVSQEDPESNEHEKIRNNLGGSQNGKNI